uniref:Transposase n=1 Tax=Caenorhabditis tropicalis TaxID=1561998 RepID=A0A1I7UXF8_9PELO
MESSNSGIDLDPIVLRHLQTKKVEERIEDLNNQIWIGDDSIGYRLVTVIDEGLSDLLVGFRDEQGFFEKVSRTISGKFHIS